MHENPIASFADNLAVPDDDRSKRRQTLAKHFFAGDLDRSAHELFFLPHIHLLSGR